MQIQVLLFKNDLVLISKVIPQDVDQLSGQPDWQLVNPVRILCKDEEADLNKRLIQWPDSEITTSTTMSVYSDDILTIVEPQEELLKAYETLIKE
jgi:hypothetical protein